MSQNYVIIQNHINNINCVNNDKKNMTIQDNCCHNNK